MSNSQASAPDYQGSSSRKRKHPIHPDPKGPTVLTQAPAKDCEEHETVVVGHYVQAGVARRSGLLAGIGSMAGQAPLPDHISPEDVQLWQAACIVDLVPSTRELLTVLRVRSRSAGSIASGRHVPNMLSARNLALLVISI